MQRKRMKTAAVVPDLSETHFSSCFWTLSKIEIKLFSLKSEAEHSRISDSKIEEANSAAEVPPWPSKDLWFSGCIITKNLTKYSIDGIFITLPDTDVIFINSFLALPAFQEKRRINCFWKFLIREKIQQIRRDLRQCHFTRFWNYSISAEHFSPNHTYWNLQVLFTIEFFQLQTVFRYFFDKLKRKFRIEIFFLWL